MSTTPVHACSQCGQAFHRPSALKVHMNTHTGAKPFLCPWKGCEKTFSVNSNMRRHLRTHTDDEYPDDEDVDERELTSSKMRKTSEEEKRGEAEKEQEVYPRTRLPPPYPPYPGAPHQHQSAVQETERTMSRSSSATSASSGIEEHGHMQGYHYPQAPPPALYGYQQMPPQQQHALGTYMPYPQHQSAMWRDPPNVYPAPFPSASASAPPPPRMNVYPPSASWSASVSAPVAWGEPPSSVKRPREADDEWAWCHTIPVPVAEYRRPEERWAASARQYEEPPRAQQSRDRQIEDPLMFEGPQPRPAKKPRTDIDSDVELLFSLRNAPPVQFDATPHHQEHFSSGRTVYSVPRPFVPLPGPTPTFGSVSVERWLEKADGESDDESHGVLPGRDERDKERRRRERDEVRQRNGLEKSRVDDDYEYEKRVMRVSGEIGIGIGSRVH